MTPSMWQSLAVGFGFFGAFFAVAFIATARRLRRDRRWR